MQRMTGSDIERFCFTMLASICGVCAVVCFIELLLMPTTALLIFFLVFAASALSMSAAAASR